MTEHRAHILANIHCVEVSCETMNPYQLLYRRAVLELLGINQKSEGISQNVPFLLERKSLNRISENSQDRAQNGLFLKVKALPGAHKRAQLLI